MRCAIPNLALLVLLLAGCDSTPQASRAEALLPEITGEGRVRGRVLFGSEPPVMSVIANTSCHSDAEPIWEETVVVNDNGTLRNVLVYLKGAPAVDGSSQEAALLDQINCRFEPRVVGVQLYQPLRIRSSDPTLHNVQYQPRHNHRANFGLTRKGAERAVVFDTHEIFRVKCDVHPWMTAYIGVFDNPFFATTGEDGAFEIAGIPDGSYTLVAWHEKYGPLEKPLTIVGADPIELDFLYRSP